MSFVSFEFLALVAILLVLYYTLAKRAQWPLLLAGSFVFYAFASPKYLIYMAATILTTWGAGVKIANINAERDSYLAEHKDLPREEKKAVKGKAKKRSHTIMGLCLLFNLGMLAVVKYTNFVISNINSLFGTDLGFFKIALPMGLSFYIFQSMGYIIDVHRGKYPAEKNLAKLALFVSFFPQLIQGPISRFDDLSKTLYGPHSFDARNVCFGAWRVLWGYFKKLVIADRMVVAITTITGKAEKYPGVYVVALVFFYAIQLYADFTGGIDITIGIAQMFGVKVTENFDRPFFSLNVTEYWRRWHITMGTWFKDYIFYPISVSQTMLNISKWSREKLGPQLGKRVPVYLSTIIVWFATGVWHGAAWNFIVWGLLNCLVIIVSQEFSPLYKKFHERFAFSNTKGYNVFQMFRTFWLMGLIRILDVYQNVPLTFRMVGTIFTTPNWGALFDGSMLKLGLTGSDYIVLLCGSLLMLLVSILQNKGSVREQLSQKPIAVRYLVIWLLFVAIVVLGAYGIGYDARQFIYNQF